MIDEEKEKWQAAWVETWEPIIQGLMENRNLNRTNALLFVVANRLVTFCDMLAAYFQAVKENIARHDELLRKQERLIDKQLEDLDNESEWKDQ